MHCCPCFATAADDLDMLHRGLQVYCILWFPTECDGLCKSCIYLLLSSENCSYLKRKTLYNLVAGSNNPLYARSHVQDKIY